MIHPGNKKLTLGAGLFAAVLMVSGSAYADGAMPMAPANLLASNCFSCHGMEGRSSGITEDIYGMPAEKFTKALAGFKSGEKESTVMQRISKGYSDDEIKAMAGYFAAIKK